ncbi:hypothetical protein VPH46_06790 [Sphingomonas sp. MJ1 (PH-R8)]|uniref:hypothetical protein n=1 Tax=Sphingomonas sp. MJ1 (PH-R8) TaxID=3112950 RepID=UPI003A8A8A33
MSWAALLRVWWLAPMLLLGGGWWLESRGHADTRLTLRNERVAWKGALDDAEKARLAAERRYASHIAQAAAAYAADLAAREPIIVRSTNSVREYAQTDAGRVLCRDADRVRAVDVLDAELAKAAGTTGSGAGAVRPDAAAPAGGR